MSRLYSRDDLRLAAAGILAGILTFVLVIALWFVGRGATSDSGTVSTSIDNSLTPIPQRDDPDAGPLIGKFQRDVAARLRSSQPSVAALQGPLQLVVRDIEWKEKNGRTFARAPLADGALNAVALARGDVLLSNVVLEHPEIYLREASIGVWNFQDVFYELLHSPPAPGPKRIIHLQGLRIADGYVDVKRPEDAFSFRSFNGDIRALTLSDPRLAEPRMQVATVDAVFERMSSKTRLPLHAEDANLTFPTGTVLFDVARANIENTRLAAIHGIWNPEWEGYAVQAEGDAVGFNVADFRSFAPERMPEDGTATFHFKVKPLPGDGTDVALSRLAFTATGAKASGELAFQFFPTRFQLGDVDLAIDNLALSLVQRVMGRTLPYSGSIKGTLKGPARDVRVDVVASLETPGVTPFATHVTGSIAMLENGLNVQRLAAELNEVPLAALRAFMPGLPLKGLVTGTIAVDGSPARTPVNLDMRLELGTGVATVTGVVDLTGAVPRYDVNGRIVGVDLQTIVEPNVPPVSVGAQFALAGSGFKPEEVDARLHLNGGFTGWEANPGDTLLASVRIRGGTAYVDTLVGSLATASLQSSGQWRFIEPLSGAVHYAVAVTSLEPFGPYIPVIGDSIAAGEIEASGDVTGSLERMQFAGRIKAAETRSGDWTASSFDATYAVTFGGGVPEVQLDATGRGIGTPTAGTYQIAVAKLNMRPPGFDLTFSAQRSQSAGAIELAANGVIPTTGARELFLQTAYFDLDEGRWQMARPARVSWGGDDGVRVDSLQLHNDATSGIVFLDGRVLPLARADFVASVAAFPIGDVQELMGRAPIVTGLVWGDARVQPPGDRPHIDASFRLDNGAIQGIPVTHLEGTLAYADERATARITAALDTAGAIDIDAAVPMSINLTDSTYFKLLDDGALSGHVTARSFSLAPVDSFVTMVRNVTGYLNGTVSLGGTVSEPALSGDLTMIDGSMLVPQLNQKFTDIAGTLHFDGRRAELLGVQVRSDGTAQLAGDITFERLNDPVLNLNANFDGFRPLGVDNQDDAAVDGSVAVAGKLDALVVTGNVTMRDGYLIIPQFGADITTAYGDLTTAASVLGQDLTPAASSQIMQNLAVRNLGVKFGDGVWIAAQEAKVQLAGELTVNKSQDDIRVLGDLEGQRGTYTLAAGPIVRRFDIRHALVRFQGSTEMNPAIDVDARRIVINPDGQRLNVDVHIGGMMRTPTLSLASADAPNIPQEELLSFLLFGRSTLAVGDNPASSGGLLGETITTVGGGAIEAFSQAFEERLLQQLRLPLDVFQVNLGLEGTTSLVLGRQIGDKLFVSFESDIPALGLTSGTSTAAAGMNNWALRFEWAFAPQSSLQFGIEPVRRGGRIQGLGSQLGQSLQQQFVELRRRWSW
jgi:hypothetical protein